MFLTICTWIQIIATGLAGLAGGGIAVCKAKELIDKNKKA